MAEEREKPVVWELILPKSQIDAYIATVGAIRKAQVAQEDTDTTKNQKKQPEVSETQLRSRWHEGDTIEGLYSPSMLPDNVSGYNSAHLEVRRNPHNGLYMFPARIQFKADGLQVIQHGGMKMMGAPIAMHVPLAALPTETGYVNRPIAQIGVQVGGTMFVGTAIHVPQPKEAVVGKPPPKTG